MYFFFKMFCFFFFFFCLWDVVFCFFVTCIDLGSSVWRLLWPFLLLCIIFIYPHEQHRNLQNDAEQMLQNSILLRICSITFILSCYGLYHFEMTWAFLRVTRSAKSKTWLAAFSTHFPLVMIRYDALPGQSSLKIAVPFSFNYSKEIISSVMIVIFFL